MRWAAVCLVAVMVLGAQAAEWVELPGGRYRALEPSGPSGTGFAVVDPNRSGLRFTNELAEARYITNQIYLNGSGVALGDVDGDGRCDLYFCGLDNSNRLFRNLGGWRFEDITARAGVGCDDLAAVGCLFLDLDGDRDLDLLVNSVGQGTRTFLNDGQARFTPVPGPVLNAGRSGTSTGAADFDGDGDLDVYVTNYRTDTIRDMPNTRLQGEEVNGRRVVTKVDGRPVTEPDLVGRFELSPTGDVIEHGEPDVLFRNEGGGRLVPLTFTNGVFLDSSGAPLQSPPYDWGLSVLFRDLNGDRWPDLYVCNDFETPDRIWINLGNGTFKEAPPLTLRHTSIFSMGVDAGDLNRDGYDDLLVSDMLMQSHASRQLRIGDVPPVFHQPGVIDDRPQYSFNTLQLNRGDGTYAEIAWWAGIEASGWTWCPVLLDVDLDGYEDVLFPTGHERDMMHGDIIERAEVLKGQQKLTRLELLRLRTMFARFNTPNVALRNRGDLRFEDKSAAWGFTDAAVSQGIALGDLDGDGDLDVAVNNLNDPATVYENVSTSARVAVRLRGRAPNTQGIGARLRLIGGAVPEQSQTLVAGGHYLSGDDAVRVFAAGSATNRMELEVVWPDGTRSAVTNVLANRLYEIDQAGAGSPAAAPPASSAPWFAEVAEFAPKHSDEPFDDLARQPLIPFQLNGLGPGAAWADLDDDGWDDLVIGAGKGGSPQAFRNDRQGRLVPIDDPIWTRPVGRDLTGIVAADGVVMFGSANYEDGRTNGGAIRVYDTRRKASGDSVLGPTTSTGPLALADVDADGDLDLFVGGRVVAGRYPEAGVSAVFRNDAGRFVPLMRWEQLGLVSGAVFSDLDLDGWPDLALACEWGPVRVFRNEGGKAFRETTETLGLGASTGWWRSIATGDFNGDGRPDLVAGNWGLNSRYVATPAHPARLRYGDIDGDLIVDLIESRVEPVSGRELPTRGLRMVGIALPWLRDHIGTYEAYGKASLQDLYGDRLQTMRTLEAANLASMVWLNRGDRFEAHPLPDEAQWSPVFGVCVADFNGDGAQDLYLGQNFSGLPPDGARQDAGRGLVLQGDGQGGFRAVPVTQTGIRAYGDQRGAATADFDGDGRTDLLATQHANVARLFRNVFGSSGLRVRLQGPSGNRLAVGSAVRLGTPERWGPAREVRAGGGYWSQDSCVLVLHSREPATRLEVRWPGGARTVSDLPTGAREVLVKQDGSLTVLRASGG